MRKKKTCVSREYTVVIFLAMDCKRVLESLAVLGKSTPDPIYPRNMVVFRGRVRETALEIAFAGIHPIMFFYIRAKNITELRELAGAMFDEDIAYLKEAWTFHRGTNRRRRGRQPTSV